MKNVKSLLKLFLIIGVCNGCSTKMDIGGNDSGITLPVRPISEICVTGNDRNVYCFDPRHSPDPYVREIKINDVCTNSSDYFINEAWLKTILK